MRRGGGKKNGCKPTAQIDEERPDEAQLEFDGVPLSILENANDSDLNNVIPIDDPCSYASQMGEETIGTLRKAMMLIFMSCS